MNLHKLRIGNGVDFHRFSEETGDFAIPVGGILIPFSKNVLAHSDGDVVIHSICDSIFGALCEGNIGTHFPPSNEKLKNANSQIFLEYANNLLKSKGGIINIDCTVICEAPKIMPYALNIKRNLAKILSISEDVISIKAVTTEKMGFCGRGEGIGCISNILICLE